MASSVSPLILALDLARVTGWAYGRAGEVPRCGSKELATAGSGNGTVGRGLLRWMTGFLAISPVEAIYVEAPRDPRHMGNKTTLLTARQLIGLCFLADTVAEASGIYRVREADVQDVREVFLGQRRPPDGKDAVQRRCRQLGWSAGDDNAADAAALWAFGCHVEARGVPLALGETIDIFARPKRQKHDDIEDISI
ncbi:MAG: hypothetical protein DI527_00385 [Chelatococcus sp.]|nr:MAG: hypothetical protein DI527_00385 [Chelatococcus sp.]